MSLVGAQFFIGIEWAARTHAVCVLDPTGRRMASFPSRTPRPGSPP